MFKNKIHNSHRLKTVSMLVLYRPIFCLLLICGFNFCKSIYSLRILARIYCVILIIVTTFATIACCAGQELTQIWSLIEYVSSVIVILVCKNKLTIFFKKLTQVDFYLRVNKKNYYATRNKMFIYTIIIWIFRIFYTGIYCISYPCYDYVHLFLINQFSLLSLDINRVWRFILFDMIRLRLKILRTRLEETPVNFYLYVKNNVMVKEDKVRLCLCLYRSIADTLDLISPVLHASLFVSIICSIPKLIINAYNILLVIENQVPVVSLGFVLLHISQISFSLFSPCIVLELYSVEVENIRLYLMNKLIDETDEKIKADVELFLRYTEIRTFRYRIWRIIPVNMTLPVELISLCTTYVVVIINFTHLY